MLRRPTLLFTCLAAVTLGCGGATETTMPRTAHPNVAPRAAPASATGIPPMTAHRFAEVSDVVGPYVGRDGDLSLAAWAEATPAGRSLFAAVIDAKAIPGKPVRVGNLASELDLVLVRGFGAASAKAVGHPRFAIVTTRRGARSGPRPGIPCQSASRE